MYSTKPSDLQQSPSPPGSRHSRSGPQNGYLPRSQLSTSRDQRETHHQGGTHHLPGFAPRVPSKERERQSAARRFPSQSDDYPYELQLKLFGNHLLALAEEATRFDFRGTYTATEVADILQVTPAKIYALLHTGEIPSVKVGRQFRVGKFAFWAYMNGLDSEELVEQILDRFVTQHCCRDGKCVVVGGRG